MIGDPGEHSRIFDRPRSGAEIPIDSTTRQVMKERNSDSVRDAGCSVADKESRLGTNGLVCRNGVAPTFPQFLPLHIGRWHHGIIGCESEGDRRLLLRWSPSRSMTILTKVRLVGNISFANV
jgi:hypothetical protein